MFKVASIAVIIAIVLSGCTTIPTEYTSPCACLYEPINNTPENGATA